MQYLLEVIKWWFVIEIIGLVALPITAYMCNKLPDKGYSVSKIMGLLLLTYISWITTYFGFEYDTALVLMSLFIMAIISYIFYRNFGIMVNKSFVVKNEIFFAVVFFIFLVIRSYSPDNYWGLAEKFMDVAFINSTLKSSVFPPTDPWFSGMPMNYYYFGYLLISNLIKLTSTSLNIGFNIASAIFYALSASATFGIGFALLKKVKYGLITFGFVLVFGNLVGFLQLLVILFSPSYYEKFHVPDTDLLTRMSTFSQLPSVKVIPDSFSEVPYQVYLIGDLHSNLISISFQLLILAVILNIIMEKKITNIQAIMISLCVGFLFPLNTWDYPTYLVIILVVVFLKTNNFKKQIELSITIMVLSILLYIPYHLNYQKAHTIAVVYGRTEALNFLMMFGVFIYLIYYYYVSIFNKKSIKTGWLRIVFPYTVLSLLAILINFQLLIFLIPIVLFAYSTLIKENLPEKRFIYLIILIGTLLGIFVELFYVKDNLIDAGYFRYNTIFKVYSQIWVLWGIAASYFFYKISKKKGVYFAYLLILMAMVFPVFATISQSDSFDISPTLDGEIQLKKSNPYEYEAIEWLRGISGMPVVLQASGFSYNWNSYISTFTGLPTVLGWEWHEYQWRMNLTEIETRRKDVEIAYTSPDYNDIKKIIDKYHIKYIYAGPVERDRYNITNVFDKNPDNFKLVFENRDVKVYEV